MKYVNSLKYMNSFGAAEKRSEISQKRARELCELLGRVHIGTRYVCIPDGSAGHSISVMLESVIKHAGYRVGRISSEADLDSRGTVFIDGEIPSIDDYNRSVAELKNALQKTPDVTYYKEEATFALSLLLCKLEGCEYVILEGLSNDSYGLDAICAPYDLIIMPTIYEGGVEDSRIKAVCDSIRRGTREVVSGNQRSEIYNIISNACALSGVRLYIPVKAQFEINSISSRRLEFSYGGRDGYVLKNPSHMQRDCAMTVIESALAIRRDGVKMPWGSIAQGIERATDTGCFDIISLSPAIITDTAHTKEEIELLLKSFCEVFDDGVEFVICLKTDGDKALAEQLSAFKDKRIRKVLAMSDSELKLSVDTPVIACNSAKDFARLVYDEPKDSCAVLCMGDVSFNKDFKTEFIKLMGY